MACRQTEIEKLAERFDAAVKECNQRKCKSVFDSFVTACQSTVAVFACWLQKLHREVATGYDVYETFYDLERIRLQSTSPGKYEWAKLRIHAELELLGSHHHFDKLHYASLSLNGKTLATYGDCSIQLREDMIAHRATCFEGNSAVLYADTENFSTLLRSDWENRHRLCGAVFTHKLSRKTRESAFPDLLVKDGAQPEHDEFIEVHIFGPMTPRTFKIAVFDGKDRNSRDKILLRAAQQKLAANDVQVVRA